MLDQLITWAALLFSGIALFISIRVYRRQSLLAERQLAEYDREARRRVQAEVSAHLVGPTSHRRIEIRNHGPAEARDVNLQVLGANSPIPANEAAAKLPVTVLQPTGSISLIAAISNSCLPPFHVLLTWRDGTGDRTRESTLA